MNRSTAKTELFAQWKQGSMVVADQGQSTGARFWVDSATGTDGTGYGKNPDAPFATIDYAVGQCTANKGDVIYVMPGHDETVIAAGGLDLDVAGISVIGLGSGEDRPTITFTTADTADADVDGVSITLKNLIFKNGIDSQNIMLDVNSDDCTVDGCEFREGASTQFDIAIDATSAANGADRLKVYNTRIIGTADGPTAGIELGEVNDGVEIVNCYIDGDFSDAGIHNPTGKVLTNLLLKGNIIANRETGDHAIELVSACTGFAIDNRMYGDTLGTIFDPGSLKCLGNLETDAIDQAGVDSPRTSAGGFPDDSITAAAIANGAIDATAIATGAIDADALAADTILGADNNNNAFASTSVAANEDGSLIERLEQIQEAVNIGSGTSLGANKSLVDALGWNGLVAVAGGALNYLPRCVAKLDGAVLNATLDPLFTISGGPVYAKVFGLVTTIIGGAANMSLQLTTTAPAATVDLNAAPVAIDNDAVGTVYRNVGATGVFTPSTALGMVIVDPVTVEEDWYFLAPGSLGALGSAAQTGVIAWYMYYIPLSPASNVVAAS